MKISDDERRDIAARLRKVRSVPEWATTACCIAELIGEYDYPLWDSSKQLFDLLADLIEPEPERTCKMIPNGEDGICATLTCSECGNCESVYAVCADDFNFCPNCGAEVV